MSVRTLGIACLALLLSAGTAGAEDYGIGRRATPAQIAGWDIDILPDGTGLPAGHGSVSEGRAIFAERCAGCHGAEGEGKPMDRIVGGQGTLGSAKPVKTVGSFWPYATTLYDFVHRAMPFDAPQSLSPDQTYAVVAYVLFLNGLVPADATLDAQSLPQVSMPNRHAFISAWDTSAAKP